MMFVIITTTVQFCSQTIRQKSLIVLAMGPAKQQSLQELAQGRLRVHNKEKTVIGCFCSREHKVNL